MMPEQKARLRIDALLARAVRYVPNRADVSIHAMQGVAISKVVIEVDDNFHLARLLRREVLPQAFSAQR